MPSTPLSPADQTRMALIHAGLKLFARQGFGGTATREIAALAKANIGSIAYHFGGKEGLHAACADFIVDKIRTISGAALADAVANVSDVETAHEKLSVAVDQMISFLVGSPEAADVAQFILRELSQPSAALDRIYSGVFEPSHRQLCQIWQQATGEDAESDATKLTVFSLIGQIVYFRIAREAVLRRMGWDTVAPAQAAMISGIVKDNLNAILTAKKGSRS